MNHEASEGTGSMSMWQIGRAFRAFWATLNDRLFLNLPAADREKAACDLEDSSLLSWVRWALATSARFYEKDAAKLGRELAEVVTQHGVISLALLTLQSNATKATFSVKGVTYRGEEKGDWRVVIEQTPSPLDPRAGRG